MNSTSNYAYIGSELDVFNLATNWKSYYHELIAGYIGSEVLEVGAGIGATTEGLCRGRAHRRWLCLEPDAMLASRVRESIASRRLPECCEAMVGTLEDIPSDDLFDTILYIDVLEHIEDDKHEVEAAAQHLRPGGHLVILAPAHQSLYTPFDAAIGHFRRYDKQSLSAVIPPNLTEKALFYVDSAGALASAGNKLVLRSDNPQARQIVFWDRVLIPISRKLDWLLCYNIGKSVIGIWRRI